MKWMSHFLGWRSGRTCSSVSFLVLLAFAADSSAGIIIGVGQDPAPPSGPFVGDDANNDTIQVGSFANQISIVPDVDGPAWTKDFVVNRDGQGWSTDGPNSIITVRETIRFLPADPNNPLGPPRIVDWHEDIDPTFGDGANFKWVGGSLVFMTSPFPPFPGTVSGDGKSISFDFGPFGPFVPIEITKQLMWIGPETAPGANGTNNYSIRVHERPSIPEPSTLAIACVSLAVMGSQLRRQRTGERGE